MAELIRAFIAIELDDAQHRALAEVQARLQRDRAASRVRWVAPENIHLTLKFLGDVDAAKMVALQRALADVCASTPPFALRIAGVGAFPDTPRPTVIWVGVSGEVERAALLAQEIDAACAALGFAREARAFSPHVTLGRVQRDAARGDRQKIGALIANAQVGELGALRVERLAVMKSELRPSGSIYTRLAALELKE